MTRPARLASERAALASRGEAADDQRELERRFSALEERIVHLVAGFLEGREPDPHADDPAAARADFLGRLLGLHARYRAWPWSRSAC